jgi:ABC-type transporter Mla MlaB component
MLKISQIPSAEASPTLKLEGKLLEPWVDELLRACDVRTTKPQDVRLDLSAVSFVDLAGIKVLRELIQRGIRIAACSGYVSELLHLEKR